MSLKNPKLLLLVMVVIAGLWTLWAPAQTATFTFVSWGDSRGTTKGAVNTADLSALSNQAHPLNPAFTLFAGDLCDGFDTTCTSTGTSGWEYAINGGTSNNGTFNITFPFRGNHDSSARLWDSFFSGRDTIVSTIGGTNFNFYKKDGPERTYSFDFMNSHVVGIDMPRGDISTMTRGQISWLDADIAAAETRGVTHTFIMTHGPFYFVDGHSSTPSPALIAVMNSHPSISATFHGHEHVMAHIHIDATHIPGVTHPWEEFVTGAAGAPLYTCDQNRLLDATDFCEDTDNGFMSIDVNGNTGTVDLFLQHETGAQQSWTFTQP